MNIISHLQDRVRVLCRALQPMAVLRPLSVTALFAACTVACLAQASSGITGTVTDSSGSIIPGAAVEILNTSTQQTVKTVTSSAGTYTATGLQPGRYTVTVTAPGFSKTIKDQVNVEVSSQPTIDVMLTTGNVDTTVNVTAPLISVNTTRPELGTTIEPEVVNALPTAIGGGRGRQIDNFIFLAPGVQGDTFSHRINGGTVRDGGLPDGHQSAV